MDSEEKESLDLPWTEALLRASDWRKRGATLYFKFSCEACGARLAFEEPNHVYEEGVCDKCGHVSDLMKNGIGFVAVFTKPEDDYSRN